MPWDGKSSRTSASSEVMASSAPGMGTLTACEPVATRMFLVRRRWTAPSGRRTSTVCGSRTIPRPSAGDVVVVVVVECMCENVYRYVSVATVVDVLSIHKICYAYNQSKKVVKTV